MDKMIALIVALPISAIIAYLPIVTTTLPGLRAFGWVFTLVPIVSVVISILYEGFFKNNTVGKKTYRIHVESATNSHILWFIRTMIKHFSFFYILSVVGIVSLYWMWFNDESSSIHDSVSRTRVYESLD